MLAQAETVAAPTYLVFNETTTLAVVIGGAFILDAVVTQASQRGRVKTLSAKLQLLGVRHARQEL